VDTWDLDFELTSRGCHRTGLGHATAHDERIPDLVVVAVVFGDLLIYFSFQYCQLDALNMRSISRLDALPDLLSLHCYVPLA
jgi:hypothetical protein